MIALILAGHLLGGAVPPPHPQGTDLLWSQALAFDSDGMPMIPLGIAEGRDMVEVILEAPATVLLGQKQPRRLTILQFKSFKHLHKLLITVLCPKSGGYFETTIRTDGFVMILVIKFN